MPVCYVDQAFSASFAGAVIPRLTSIYKVEGQAYGIPRVMHAHEELLEIVFIRSGDVREDSFIFRKDPAGNPLSLAKNKLG